MFGNNNFKKNDPLVAAARQAMQYGDKQRQAETEVCAEMGIQSRKALPHEQLAEFDSRLKSRVQNLTEAKKDDDREYGVDTERSMAKKGKMLPDTPTDDKKTPFKGGHHIDHPEKAPARSHLKAMIKKARKTVSESEEMGAVKKKEKPETYRHKTSGKEIVAVKKPASGDWVRVKPAKKMEEETLDELNKSTINKYQHHARRARADAAWERDYAHGVSKEWAKGSPERENAQKTSRTAAKLVNKRTRGLDLAKKRLATMKEETLDELNKSTLASYIKKASHDVATKSAAVGRYADRANKARDEIKKGNYEPWKQGRKDDAMADKMFKKSWKRREGIAKAADKMAAEEAPPGAKYERMVKHIKAGYAKDGTLSPQEKAIAYATAWKAKNKKKMSEAITLDSVLDEISRNLGIDIREQSAIDNQPVGAKLGKAVSNFTSGIRNFFTRSDAERDRDNADRSNSVGQGANRTQGTPARLAPAVNAQANAARRESQVRAANQVVDPMGGNVQRPPTAAQAAPAPTPRPGSRMMPGGRGTPEPAGNARPTAPTSTPAASTASPDANITSGQARQIAKPATTAAPAPRPAAQKAAQKPDTAGLTAADFAAMVERGKNNTGTANQPATTSASTPAPAPKPAESRWKPPSFNNQDVMPGSG